MLTPLPLIVLTLLFSAQNALLCSKSPPIHHKSTLTRDRVTGQLSEQTLVTISIGLKETACFSIESSKYWHKNEVYGISLDDVKSVLQYKNSYTFGVPDVDVKCICDCPGVEDFCNSNTNSCQENGFFGLGTCYNWYRQGMSNAGCTAFLSGSAEVCCSITVEPRNRTVWRAIELGRSSNRAVFTVTSLNTQNTKTTEVDIEGGHPILEPFYLTVSAPAINSPLRPGWYFGSDHRQALYGGVELNTLSEYDTNKLGWYKYTRGEFEMDKSEIMDSFSIEVKNCDQDELNVEFDNKNTLKTFNQATELNQLYKTSLSRVLRLDDERRVEAFFRQYSNIELTLTLEGDYNVVQVFDVSHFKDFDGEVMMDKHSNYFVNITIYEGQGSIRGNLTVGEQPETDVFKINIPQHKKEVSVFYIRLSSLCQADQSARLCLWTEVGVDSVLCKKVICDREPLQEFELPDSVIEYEKGEKMSILSPSTWAKHLNPLEWFNGITNWKEAVIMATELVGVLTVIGIILKVLKIFGCLGKCWGCICQPLNFDWCKRKKKVKPKTSISVDKEHRQLLDDQIVLSDGSTVTWNQNFRNRSHSSESSPTWKVSGSTPSIQRVPMKKDVVEVSEEFGLETPISPENETPGNTKLRLIVMTMCLSIFSTNLVSSMCAPFYPRSAAHHGLDSEVTGTILGVYYATTVIASPFMPLFMTKIGQANLMQAGLVLVGISSLIFGALDLLESGVTFGVISFVLRGLQGFGCAATETAVFAIASSRFTKDLGKVNSYLNSFMGVSFMLGPPVGGLLYSWTNFFLPFLVSAILCFVSILMINIVFKNLRESRLDNHHVSLKVIFTKSSHLLCNIRFSWILLTAMFGTACTSFLDPTLSPYLARKGFNNTAFIGIFYMIRDIAFTVGTPPVGSLIDTYKWNPSTVLLTGATLAGLGYVLIGLVGVFITGAVTARMCLSLIFIGTGSAPIFSATLPAMIEEATALGLKRDDDFCGIMAALQSFAFYGGLWAGSVVSGACTYYYGFPLATGCFGTVVIIVALLHANIHIFMPKRITYQSIESLDMLQE